VPDDPTAAGLGALEDRAADGSAEPAPAEGAEDRSAEGAEVRRVGRVGDGEQVAEGQAGRGRELVRVLAAVVDGLGQGRVVGLLTAVAVASLLVRSVGVTAT